MLRGRCRECVRAPSRDAGAASLARGEDVERPLSAWSFASPSGSITCPSTTIGLFQWPEDAGQLRDRVRGGGLVDVDAATAGRRRRAARRRARGWCRRCRFPRCAAGGRGAARMRSVPFSAADEDGGAAAVVPHGRLVSSSPPPGSGTLLGFAAERLVVRRRERGRPCARGRARAAGRPCRRSAPGASSAAPARPSRGRRRLRSAAAGWWA